MRNFRTLFGKLTDVKDTINYRWNVFKREKEEEQDAPQNNLKLRIMLKKMLTCCE